ncbi:MAG: ABC transporter permease [Planctomycetota bacterium]|nr:ABC transporter permease subunit [Planctomycetaceae bacterium]MDQ3331065.1 ABC transporter permease [Planctomycetota bacterium]
MTSREALSRLRVHFTLPLFVKDLTEAASRRRTYVLRGVYAGILFLLALIFARDVLFPAGDGFAVLGRGGKVYMTVMLIQFGGVYLFLPAFTAAAITAEKERNTLGLLFLTKLSPTKIVIEKYLGRVFPMLSLALLSLPLLGVAYTLGGLDAPLLVEGFVRLVATILMIGAIGIACSAWCRTTAGAFLLTYAILALLFPGPIFLVISLGLQPNSHIIEVLGTIGSTLRLMPIDEPTAIIGIFFGPLPMIMWMDQLERGMVGATAFLAKPAWLAVWQTAPLLAMAFASLVVARLSIVRRAEAKSNRYLARSFARLDQSFRELNTKYAKGIEIVKTGGALPDDAPVAWRETTKTTLGSFRYLVRVLLLVEVPVLLIGATSASSFDNSGIDSLGMIGGLLWLGGGLLAAVKGAGLFTAERSRQSLDVLLTTPMTTRAILRQKLAGVWRLITVCAVPVATTMLLLAYLRYSVVGSFLDLGVLYFITATVVLLTHFALAAYLSTYIGLRLSTQSKAMLASVAVLVGLCLTGPVLRLVIDPDASNYRFSPLSIYSPAAVIGELMWTKLDPGDLIYLLIANSFVYGGMALGLRVACSLQISQLLGRAENEPYIPVERRIIEPVLDFESEPVETGELVR